MSTNSFDSRAELTVGDRSVLDLPPRRAAVPLRRRPPALLAEDPAREPAAQRGRRDDPRPRHRGPGQLGRHRHPQPGDGLHARPRGHAGLHRRARDRGPRRDARRDARTGRRREQDQSARPGRAGHRSLRPGRRVRHPRRVPAQRRARVRAQRGALRVPALGPGRLSQLQRRPARHRDRAPGQPRVPVAGRVRRRRRQPRLSRHAGRHRLAHDDGQRPRRARLGRGRDRGRGGDARPADVDADPPGARLPPGRRAARRARPRPTWC